MKKIIILFSLCFYVMHGVAQDRRISEKDVPAPVPAFLNTHFPGSRQLKYFKDKENDTVFIEATFKYAGSEYAVKFLRDGSMWEIEREIEFSSLPAELRGKMESELKTQFNSFRVTMTEEINPGAGLKYELNVKGKMKEGKSVRYTEAYFDHNGNLIEIEVIPLKSIQTAF